MNKELFGQQCNQVREICGPNGWDLYNNSTADKQAMYMLAEAGELALSVAKEDYSEAGLMDDIGDVLVTVVNYCELAGVDIDAMEALSVYDFENEGYENIYDAARWLAANLSSLKLNHIIPSIMSICDLADLDINECFQLAINTISKRTGTYTNGVFVKDQ